MQIWEGSFLFEGTVLRACVCCYGQRTLFTTVHKNILHQHTCISFPCFFYFFHLNDVSMMRKSALVLQIPVASTQHGFVFFCVFRLGHVWTHLIVKFTTRCLICFATDCVPPLCIHYRLNHRTFIHPLQADELSWTLHNLEYFKTSLVGRKTYFFYLAVQTDFFICEDIQETTVTENGHHYKHMTAKQSRSTLILKNKK